MSKEPYDRRFYARFNDTLKSVDEDLWKIDRTVLADETKITVYVIDHRFPETGISLPSVYTVGVLRTDLKKVRRAIDNNRDTARNRNEYAEKLEIDLQKILQSHLEPAIPA